MRSWNERVKHIQDVASQEIISKNNEKQEESEKLQEEINKIKKEMDAISKEETELKSSRIEVDQQLQKWEDAIKDNSKKVSYWKREIKKLDLQEVPGEEVTPLPELSEEEILAINMEELNYEINAIDENLAKSKPNMAAIAEYKKKEEVNYFLKVCIYPIFFKSSNFIRYILSEYLNLIRSPELGMSRGSTTMTSGNRDLMTSWTGKLLFCRAQVQVQVR